MAFLGWFQEDQAASVTLVFLLAPQIGTVTVNFLLAPREALKSLWWDCRRTLFPEKAVSYCTKCWRESIVLKQQKQASVWSSELYPLLPPDFPSYYLYNLEIDILRDGNQCVMAHSGWFVLLSSLIWLMPVIEAVLLLFSFDCSPADCSLPGLVL